MSTNSSSSWFTGLSMMGTSMESSSVSLSSQVAPLVFHRSFPARHERADLRRVHDGVLELHMVQCSELERAQSVIRLSLGFFLRRLWPLSLCGMTETRLTLERKRARALDAFPAEIKDLDGRRKVAQVGVQGAQVLATHARRVAGEGLHVHGHRFDLRPAADAAGRICEAHERLQVEEALGMDWEEAERVETVQGGALDRDAQGDESIVDDIALGRMAGAGRGRT
ncbi:hypothetical protein FH972_025202 [Carpinus fangiana]|uniref:Uncharacterized protein n=1 Tax=Carpinus fangiana TaxID=176857 RepID=A0A5N6L0B9_9ROSI|nr:hypothetical protein FH972_025202 [Carpinus fangiana]